MRAAIVLSLLTALGVAGWTRAAAAAPCTSANCCTSGSYCWLEDRVNATYVWVGHAVYNAGAVIDVCAKNSSATLPPEVHLTYGSFNGAVVEKAYGFANDDNNTNSCFTYTVPQGQGGDYYLTIHAFNPSTGGQTGLYFDLYVGGSFVNRIRTGGYTIVTNQTSQESFDTVLVNDGAGGTALARMDYNGNHYALAQVIFGGGIGDASRLMGNGQSKWLITIKTLATREGPVRAIRNDAQIPGHDADGDGLGDNLEDQLCTCKRTSGTVCGYDCGLVKDARDTDGDGLADYWEVFGCASNTAQTNLPLQARCPNAGAFTGYDPQYLPRWGASPRHKDLLVEVDRAAWGDLDPGTATEPCAYGSAAQCAPRFTPAQAAWAAQRYADLKGQNNPDGVDGVAAHYDLDLNWSYPPTDPRARDCDPTGDGISPVCGNFGGASLVPTARYTGDPKNPHARFCPDSGQNALYLTNMAVYRRGLFHWEARQYGSAGSTIGDGTPASCFGDPSDVNAAHEMGHQFGLQHWGVPATEGLMNRKPNYYVSIMNYICEKIGPPLLPLLRRLARSHAAPPAELP